MIILPSEIKKSHASGGGNITAGYAPPEEAALKYLRIHFVGGSGTADVTISHQSDEGAEWNTDIAVFPDRGTGADLYYVVADHLLTGSIFQPTAPLVISWTNPSTTTWGIEIGWIPTRILSGY